MNIKYFRDTDTALLEFSEAPIVETRELSEHVTVDLDQPGNVVAMTIEHAAERARLPHLSFEEIGVNAA